jgi:hypothetical protein
VGAFLIPAARDGKVRPNMSSGAFDVNFSSTQGATVSQTIRGSQPMLAYCSAILFAITLAQTAIGHLITDNGADGLVAIHIPLAFVIFGLTIWITGRAVRLNRS